MVHFNGMKRFIELVANVAGLCWGVYIDNSNIDVSHLYDGVHLNQEGSVLLRDSYLLELNGLYWDDVILKSNR